MQTSAVAALPNSIGCTHLDLAVLVKVSRHYLSQKKNKKKPVFFFHFFGGSNSSLHYIKLLLYRAQ